MQVFLLQYLLFKFFIVYINVLTIYIHSADSIIGFVLSTLVCSSLYLLFWSHGGFFKKIFYPSTCDFNLLSFFVNLSC